MSPSPAVSVAEKRRAFFRLHESGCFAIPNPWDVGSAKYLETLGFKALASTSSGFAWSQGRPDGSADRDTVLAHLAQMVAATDLPLNADFESGFAHTAAELAENVRLAIETGVAGLSIEDATGQAASPLYPIDIAVQRLRAARQAIDQAGGEVLLVGRAECFLLGRPDLAEAITRLKAYANAGADCLYAPGIDRPEQIAELVAAVAPKPVNLLVGGASALNMTQIAALGVRRVSLGGALARAAWSGLIRSATLLAQQGRFDEGLSGIPPATNLSDFFASPRA